MPIQNERYELVEGQFDPETEEQVRALTTPEGLPQDLLVWADYEFVGWCGISCQFRWASGRQDAVCFLDMPEAEMKALHGEAWMEQMQRFLDNREQLRLKLKAKTKGQGHGKGIGADRAADSLSLQQAAAG